MRTEERRRKGHTAGCELERKVAGRQCSGTLLRRLCRREPSTRQRERDQCAGQGLAACTAGRRSRDSWSAAGPYPTRNPCKTSESCCRPRVDGAAARVRRAACTSVHAGQPEGYGSMPISQRVLTSGACLPSLQTSVTAATWVAPPPPSPARSSLPTRRVSRRQSTLAPGQFCPRPD